MQKDLQYLVKHVTEWPTYAASVLLMPDGEICFQDYDTVGGSDFYPEGIFSNIDHPCYTGHWRTKEVFLAAKEELTREDTTTTHTQEFSGDLMTALIKRIDSIRKRHTEAMEKECKVYEDALKKLLGGGGK